MIFREALKIPVISNGNILYFEDIQRCLDVTGADRVMSAEGNLYNPAIFAGINPPVWQMAKEYLEICQTIPTKIAYIRGHLFKIYRPALPFHTDLREQLAKINTLEEMFALSEELRERLMVNIYFGITVINNLSCFFFLTEMIFYRKLRRILVKIQKFIKMKMGLKYFHIGSVNLI